MVCFVNPLRRPHRNITFFAVLARRVGSPSMMVPFGAQGGSRARPDGASLARRAAGRFAARSRRAARSQRLDRVPSAATRRPMADGGRGHATTPAERRAAAGCRRGCGKLLAQAHGMIGAGRQSPRATRRAPCGRALAASCSPGSRPRRGGRLACGGSTAGPCSGCRPKPVPIPLPVGPGLADKWPSARAQPKGGFRLSDDRPGPGPGNLLPASQFTQPCDWLPPFRQPWSEG